MMLPWRILQKRNILGMNARNADFIMQYNRRRFYPMVDDKLQTKRLALRAGIAVPALYGVIRIIHDLERLGQILEPFERFVIKPAHGSGGKGIMVIERTPAGRFRKSSGELLSEDDLAFYVSNILGGEFSLGGRPDVAMIESRVEFDPLFEGVSYQGVPDIRVIVFRGVPVMAMMRLPTRMSDGKANLHQGAVGAGIDIGSGVTTGATWRDRPLEEHPDTGHAVIGLQLPDWSQLVELAAGCSELVELGYLGVDIVFDRKLGPLMLELNARPGLSIQIANRQGLITRLRRLEKMPVIPPSAAARAALARDWFGRNDGQIVDA